MITWIWCILTIFLIVVEILTINLVSIWFIPGAILGTVLSYFKIPVYIQIITFILSTIITAIIFKKYYKKYKDNKEDINSIVGKTALVIQGFSDLPGKVIINDVYWSAISENGEAIPEDSIVKVEKVEGNKLIVSLIKILHD